jgi:hypothetical protein
MPKFDPQRQWTIAELNNIADSSSHLLMPIMQAAGGYQRIRGGDGVGMCGIARDDNAIDVAFLFETGEVWAADTFLLSIARDGERMLFLPQKEELLFCRALEGYASLLEKLGISGPYRWFAGMEDTKGRTFQPPVQPGKMANPWMKQRSLKDYVEAEGHASHR